jgi:cation diffusion facilitator CzcD-associated flavoprotein CzcO
MGPERQDTIVIGGGQAGLTTGYHLRRQQQRFVILDAERRVGGAWRRRWDSLRLFTPASYSSRLCPGGTPRAGVKIGLVARRRRRCLVPVEPG